MSRKITESEWKEIDRIDREFPRDLSPKIGKQVDFLIEILSRWRPKSKQRYVWEMIECNDCDGVGSFKIHTTYTPAGSIFTSTACMLCGGLGKVRVKVKR